MTDFTFIILNCSLGLGKLGEHLSLAETSGSICLFDLNLNSDVAPGFFEILKKGVEPAITCDV